MLRLKEKKQLMRKEKTRGRDRRKLVGVKIKLIKNKIRKAEKMKKMKDEKNVEFK